MDKKILRVNIINFKKVDKPRGGARIMWISFLLLNFSTYVAFMAI